MTDRRQLPLSYIDNHQDEVVKFLQELISYPSVTGEEMEIQNFISKWLREQLGVKVDVWEPDLDELRKHPGYVPVNMSYKNRPNVIGIYKGIGGGRSLLFNGHVDVIPADPENAWRLNPWKGEVDGGRIFGRGASDMKSGLAAYTMAMNSVVQTGIELKGDVILEYTVDEELSGNGTLAAITRGYKADAGVSGETSSLRVQPASIGRIWFEVDVRGKPAGIQRSWEGVSAIEKGYKISQAVNDFERIRLDKVTHPLYPDIREAIPCIVGVFQAGSYPSAFPDSCLLKGSIATVPGENSDDVKLQFIQHIESIAHTDPWLRQNLPKVRFIGYFAEPSEIPSDHPIVKGLCADFKEVRGTDAIVSGRVGATDIRFLNKYGDTPTVIFGPGLTEQMHATNEFARVDDLIAATKIMALTTLDWCGYE